MGKLGVDANLLAAQIVNFGVLLWFLSKFLYKPLVERIEKDEAELARARKEREKLEREKKVFARIKKSEIGRARARSREILKEAEETAAEIVRRARKRAEREAAAAAALAASAAAGRQAAERTALLKEFRLRTAEKFAAAAEREIPLAERKRLQAVFWKILLKRVKGLPLEGVKAAFRKAAEKKGKGGRFKKPRAVLECAFPASAAEVGKLEKAVSVKIGAKTKIKQKLNKGLAAGFRFEIAGAVVESGLFSLARNAADIGEKE